MKEQLIAVTNMQEYIEKHLDEEITMADLARASMFSPWYSYRLFRQYSNMTPAEYIRKLRLSRSVLKLKEGNMRIIDVANELGFVSVDGYQRAFRREFGCNPSEYMQTRVPLPLFIPYGVKFKELRKDDFDMSNVQSVFVQMQTKPERKVIIKRGETATDYWKYCEEVGCDVWGILKSMDSLCGEPVCLWLPEKYKKPNTSTYVQGVEVDVDFVGVIPEGFEVITLPQSEYLMFQGEPFAEENYCEAIQAVEESMKKYNPKLIGYEWDDSVPRIQLEPIGERGYIELRAVKKL